MNRFSVLDEKTFFELKGGRKVLVTFHPRDLIEHGGWFTLDSEGFVDLINKFIASTGNEHELITHEELLYLRTEYSSRLKEGNIYIVPSLQSY
jgi:hypothetical protein